MSSRTTGRKNGAKALRRQFIYKTGLCEGTRINTTAGNLPVEYLRAGDRVLTRNGAREIKHIASRPLTDCPIQIKRGALGPGRPAQDMFLAPDQGIPLPDWRAHQYYGSDQRHVPVSRLRDGELITWGEHPGELQVYDLEFATEQIIFAEGLEVIGVALPAP